MSTEFGNYRRYSVSPSSKGEQGVVAKPGEGSRAYDESCGVLVTHNPAPDASPAPSPAKSHNFKLEY